MKAGATLTALVLLAVSLLACSTGFRPRPLQVLPTLATPVHAADPDHFIFWVFGDNRPKKAADGPTKAIRDIATAMGAAQPVLALSCGDLIEGKDPSSRSQIATEYQQIFAVLRPAGVPVYNAPGNHEMDDAKDVPNPTMQQWYAELVGFPYGSFDYGSSHFVALNTEEVASPLVVRSPRAPTDDGSTDLDPGYLSPQQLDWIDRDLALHTAAKHVFLFMHHSVHSFKSKNALDKNSAEALVAILKKYKNVTAVFSAHEHLYYNPQSKDDLTNPMAGQNIYGPRYLVTGGAGAPLQKNDHGFHHYLIVTVDGDNITIQMVTV